MEDEGESEVANSVVKVRWTLKKKPGGDKSEKIEHLLCRYSASLPTGRRLLPEIVHGQISNHPHPPPPHHHYHDLVP